ncbi:MAG: hypothetical protein GVY27_12185 [Deinococcus-Thermus bacterium]|nr:hypothetical protein [Deinococcota bacterium]
MSDLLDRLRALRGGEATDRPEEPAVERPSDPRYEGPAAQLASDVVEGEDGVHLRRRARLAAEARHGRTPLGGAGLHPWLDRWAARGLAPGAAATRAGAPGDDGSVGPGRGPVVYLDAETTGLAGGTGTYAFLVGLGVHDADGFVVEQLFLPGPEHERAYLVALAERLSAAAAVVSYNGGSFDLPLVRTRFAMHGLPDPLAGARHLDLLPLARRLWRERLPDCTLGTIEREVLGARRSTRDVPGAEVPRRYLGFLRSRDARPLRGVLEHNVDDVVALTALRGRIEAMLTDDGDPAEADERLALGRWLDRLGETEAALARFAAAESVLPEAAWEAARLLKRAGRHEEAVARWVALAEGGDPRAWIELAKHHEHRRRDLAGALAAVEAARRTGGAAYDDLERRRRRLLERRARAG